MTCAEKTYENGQVVYRDCHTGAVASQHQPAQAGAGAGTELKLLLKTWLGIEANFGCSCNAMARKMNTNGPDWCEGPGLAEIVAAMRAEHAKRRSRRKTVLPWSDFGARWLIRQACRRARANGAVDNK